MKIAVTCPMYWPTEVDARQKAWLYLASYKKFGVPPELFRPYGIGSTYFHGEFVMRVTGHIEHMKTLASEFTHVLFSDAWDVLFIAPFEEILYRYAKMGSPQFLMGGATLQNGFYNLPDASPWIMYYDTSKTYCYPSPMFYIAEIPYAIDLLSRLDTSCTHDESVGYANAWKEGWFRPTVDHSCEIFQEQPINCVVREGRLYNTVTNTYPCMVHFGGGYTNPDTGKDDSVMPWAKQFGII